MLLLPGPQNTTAVLYVVILSAALDLVLPSTPKGIIAFCNIAPALVAKVGWPYLLKGRIRNTRGVTGCYLLSLRSMVISLTPAVDRLNASSLTVGSFPYATVGHFITSYSLPYTLRKGLLFVLAGRPGRLIMF